MPIPATCTSKETPAVTGDSLHSIKKSLLQFISGTTISRFTGMIRDIILAFSFGTHEALAALFVAFRLSHVCRKLFGEGAMQSAFIPLFEELRKDSPKRAFSFFRDLTLLLSIFLGGFCIIGALFLFLSTSWIDWSPGNTLIIKLTALVLPSLFFICLFGINLSLLQCERNYFISGIAPVWFNIAVIIASLSLKNVSTEKAMFYLALSMVVGCFFQWVHSFIPVARNIKKNLGKKIFTGVHIFSQDIKNLVKPLTLGTIGVGATQINNAVDALFSRCSDAMGPAHLWYGIRLFQLPLALFGVALSGALLPPLSRAVQQNDEKTYREFLEFALRKVFALLIPASFALITLGTCLVYGIYGRGDFDTQSVYATTSCLHGYIIGLLPMGLIIVLAPAFYAKKMYSKPTVGALICLISNIVLNAIMVFVFEFKAVSVALATSISSWMNACYLFYHLKKQIGYSIISKEGSKEILKITLASCISAIIAWLYQAQFTLIPNLFHFFIKNSPLEMPFLQQMQSAIIPTILYIGMVFLFSFLFKAKDLIRIFQKNLSTQGVQDV